jgi:hypothetical protein
MDLEYRGLLAPNGFPPHANLIIPPGTTSDLRHNPRLPRPPTSFDFSPRSSEPGDMEKTPPVTGKRRGGCRKACNECKQQKVSRTYLDHPHSILCQWSIRTTRLRTPRCTLCPMYSYQHLAGTCELTCNSCDVILSRHPPTPALVVGGSR